MKNKIALGWFCSASTICTLGIIIWLSGIDQELQTLFLIIFIPMVVLPLLMMWVSIRYHNRDEFGNKIKEDER